MNNEKSNLNSTFDNIPEGKIRVLLKKVGQEPTIEIIDDTLRAKQDLVDGLIKVVYLEDDLLLVYNEEGKLFNMKPNLAFDYDYIAGDCFFISDDYKNGDFKSLTDDQIKKAKDIIRSRSIHYILPDKMER